MATQEKSAYKYSAQEARQRYYFPEKGTLVIRLDGKDVTKNKKEYDLTEKDGFTQAVHAAACSTVPVFLKSLYGGRASVFSIMDETSIVFPDAYDFLRNFDDANILYDSGIFLQEFLRKFAEDGRYKGTEFGLSAFVLPEGSGNDYIKARRKLCRKAAAVYLAKKAGLPPVSYHGKETGDILVALRAREVTLPEWEEYLSGFRSDIEKDRNSEVKRNTEIMRAFLSAWGK